MSETIRTSGLQRQVFALYRRAIRMVRTKPPSTQPKFHLFIRYTFRTQASSVSPRDIGAIEHILRKGQRQLELYENAAVTDCWVSEEMRKWDARRTTK